MRKLAISSAAVLALMLGGMAADVDARRGSSGGGGGGGGGGGSSALCTTLQARWQYYVDTAVKQPRSELALLSAANSINSQLKTFGCPTNPIFEFDD